MEDEERSSFRLRLQGQYSLTFAALLLVGGPVSLLALGATVASHLAATADVELPQLSKDTKDHSLPSDTFHVVITQVKKDLPSSR